MVGSSNSVAKFEVSPFHRTELLGHNVMDSRQHLLVFEKTDVPQRLPSPICHQPNDISFLGTPGADVSVVCIPLISHTIHNPVLLGRENVNFFRSVGGHVERPSLAQYQ